MSARLLWLWAVLTEPPRIKVGKAVTQEQLSSGECEDTYRRHAGCYLGLHQLKD